MMGDGMNGMYKLKNKCILSICVANVISHKNMIYLHITMKILFNKEAVELIT